MQDIKALNVLINSQLLYLLRLNKFMLSFKDKQEVFEKILEIDEVTTEHLKENAVEIPTALDRIRKNQKLIEEATNFIIQHASQNV